MTNATSVRPCLAFAAFVLFAGAANAQYAFIHIKAPVTGARQVVPLAISNNNMISGSYGLGSGSSHRTYGFVRSNANPPVYTTLFDPNGTGKFTYPTGINSTGYVEGYYGATKSRAFGFEYLNGSYSDFSFRGYRSTYGAGINDNGDTVGYAGGVGNQYSAYLLKGGATFFDASGATRTFAYGVNNLDEVVGYFDQGDADFAHGFIREPNGQITQIDFAGADGTFLFGIADPASPGAHTVAAGTTYSVSTGTNHGFLYSNGTYTQIDVPGSTSTTIYGINVNGWIVGRYVTSKGTFAYYGIPTAARSTLSEE